MFRGGVGLMGVVVKQAHGKANPKHLCSPITTFAHSMTFAKADCTSALLCHFIRCSVPEAPKQQRPSDAGEWVGAKGLEQQNVKVFLAPFQAVWLEFVCSASNHDDSTGVLRAVSQCCVHKGV